MQSHACVWAEERRLPPGAGQTGGRSIAEYSRVRSVRAGPDDERSVRVGPELVSRKRIGTRDARALRSSRASDRRPEACRPCQHARRPSGALRADCFLLAGRRRRSRSGYRRTGPHALSAARWRIQLVPCRRPHWRTLRRSRFPLDHRPTPAAVVRANRRGIRARAWTNSRRLARTVVRHGLRPSDTRVIGPYRSFGREDGQYAACASR